MLKLLRVLCTYYFANATSKVNASRLVKSSVASVKLHSSVSQLSLIIPTIIKKRSANIKLIQLLKPAINLQNNDLTPSAKRGTSLQSWDLSPKVSVGVCPDPLRFSVLSFLFSLIFLFLQYSVRMHAEEKEDKKRKMNKEYRVHREVHAGGSSFHRILCLTAHPTESVNAGRQTGRQAGRQVLLIYLCLVYLTVFYFMALCT